MDSTALILVLFTVACVIWMDNAKTRWVSTLLKWVPAILFAYIIPAIFTHFLDLDLSTVSLHRYSKDWIMPMAIMLVMSALSFRQLKTVGIRPILVFAGGSAAIALLPILLVIGLDIFFPKFRADIIDLGYWKGLTTIVGSWIGGSTSQLILKELSGCEEKMFLIILVVDNILVNIWTIIMFQHIKKSDSINKFLGINDEVRDYIPDHIIFDDKKSKQHILLTIISTMIVVIVCHMAGLTFLAKVLILSVVGIILGNFVPYWNHAFVIKAGGYLIITIMAILGLKLNFSNFYLPPSILYFLIIWLVLHYIIMVVLAYIFKLNMAWVPIASMANVGGISTAPAVTKAYNEEWMPHAILLAILSMVTGTYWGMLTIYLFENILIGK